MYLALHYARGKDWAQAVPVLEQIVAASPERLPAVEGLAVVRARQGRLEEAVDLLWNVYELRTPTVAELVRLGGMAMEAGRTDTAIDAFERAQRAQGRRSARISSSACSTWRPGASTTPGPPSTACLRRIPPTRWRSSSVRR